MKKYKLAKEYYKHHGNLEIPQKFKTINGYEFDENGIALGIWISTQRDAYKGKKISEEQIKLLENIGMIWNTFDYEWNKNYELAKEYYEHHGNLEIPHGFKTINGYEKDENGEYNLGRWISSQREAYKGKGAHKIAEERIKLLENIGMNWFPKAAVDEKLQQERITTQDLKRKRIEIQNRFNSILNNNDDKSLQTREELNN